MPDLSFQVEHAEPLAYAASPTLIFKLNVSNADKLEAIQCVMLRCQIRIDPVRRRYTAEDKDRLLDLYGEPERWSHTLRPMLWTHCNVMVGAFEGSVVVDMPVACTADFNIAAAKYFYALEDGKVPLNLLFSGTVFYRDHDGSMQISQISWEKEATFQLPVADWKEMMEAHYPNMAWLCLRKDVFDQLYQYKAKNSLPTWEQAMSNLLAGSEEKVLP